LLPNCCNCLILAITSYNSFAPNHWFRQVILSTWSCRCKYRKVVSDRGCSCQDTRRNISSDVIDCIASNWAAPLTSIYLSKVTGKKITPAQNNDHGKWAFEEQHLSRATNILCSSLMLLYRRYTVHFYAPAIRRMVEGH